MSKIITMPQLGETVTEGTVLSWLVKAGDVVSEDDPILEISTDKVDTEVPSPFSGTVTALLVEEGETVAVGANLLELDGDSQDIVETPSEVPEPEIQEEPEIVENETGEEVSSVVVESDSDQKLSPVVRKLLSKNNLNPSSLNGTGKDGRITRKDIEAHIATGEIPSEEKTVKEPVAEKPISSTKSTGESIPRLRKKIAENMVRSKQTSAHVMTTIEVDYEKISQLRNEIKEAFKKDEGFSLTYLPFIANATVDALKQYPVVNSSFDLDQDSHTIHSNIDLGIAVDINQEGLLVGTIKESDSYDVKALSREITSLSQKLREKNFSLEDVSGSTFTISNNGSFNSFLTSPIINQPNVAILSTESVKKKAVVVESEGNEDSIEIRHSGILSLTWDHRVFDGSVALLFLNAIKDKLENHDWSGEIS